MTTYPNREHKHEVESQTRRAIDALEALIGDAEVLRRELASGEAPIFGSQARHLVAQTTLITELCSKLEALRDSSEWWHADQAEKTETTP